MQRRRWIAWIGLPLLLLGAAGAWLAFDPGFRWASQGAGPAAELPKDEFERRVQAYLMEHPEVIIESVNQLELQLPLLPPDDAGDDEGGNR